MAQGARPAWIASLLSVHRLTKAQARRIAVRAQLLDAPRATDLANQCMATVQELGIARAARRITNVR